MKRILFVLGIISILIGLGAAVFANWQFERLVASAQFVVPAVSIPPYTVIRDDMLTVREMAATLTQEPVYRTPAQVIGKITTVPLAPGHLIYTDQAVPQNQFRLTDDERLEIVSFPISPEKAVGGQITIGHRITIYRIAIAAPPLNREAKIPAQELLAARGARAEILARAVPVVDVRAAQGKPIQPPPPSPSEREGIALAASPAPAYSSQREPLTIITVAVPPAVAQQIIELLGEQRASFDIWVTLAPLNEAQAASTGGNP